jgi:hypothetical protein
MKRPTRRICPIPGSAFALRMGLVVFCILVASAQPGTPGVSADSNAQVLTTGLQVQLLSQAAAAKKLPAVLRGVVTCYLPDSDSLVIQDATRGVYVSQISAALKEEPRLGDLFEIEGVTDRGQFAPKFLPGKQHALAQVKCRLASSQRGTN